MSTSRLLALIVLVALAAPALAQESSDPGAEEPEMPADAPVESSAVAAGLAIEVLKPELDENGQPVPDASGQPVMAFQPVADGAALLPGDEFRYIVTLKNEGSDAEDMEVALDLPAETRLLPETVETSADARFELGSSADPELREPLFVEVDGTSVPNPDWIEAPERFDQLLVEIERFASGATATVTYHLVVR